MGHFFHQFPVGTYLVKVLGQGRILKEIADVHVEDGGVQNIDSVLGVVSLTLPPSGAKKPQQPKQTPPPIQPDVVRGCVAIRNIAFQRARLILLNSNLGVSGWIENRCGRDAYVTINASFFDAYGKQVDQESEDRLVGPNGAAFRIGPDQPGPGTVYAKDGKITDVWVKFQP